jgi:hypothetical protein
MIDHQEHAEAEINGHRALAAAPERKALPPTPSAPPGPRRRSRAWLVLLLLGIAGGIAFRFYQNIQSENAAQAVAQEQKTASRSITVVAAPARRGTSPSTSRQFVNCRLLLEARRGADSERGRPAWPAGAVRLRRECRWHGEHAAEHRRPPCSSHSVW